jgi:hypothetical protein
MQNKKSCTNTISSARCAGMRSQYGPLIRLLDAIPCGEIITLAAVDGTQPDDHNRRLIRL